VIAITCSVTAFLENLIQGLSRTMSVFKDFSGLENLEKKFKDFQVLSRTRKRPVGFMLHVAKDQTVKTKH